MDIENVHTFVIPAYRESPYIEECILSLQNQTLKSNIIISTSTPSDFLTKISGKFQIPLSINDNHLGIAYDWSFAYKIAKTKYVTLAHQDDLYFPRYTELCLAAAKRYSDNTLIVFTDCNEIIQGKTISINMNLLIKRLLLLIFLFKQNIDSLFLKMSILSLGNPIVCPSVMYNKERIGNFEFSDNFKVSLDWEAWLKLAHKKGSFSYIKKRLISHRIHRDSKSSLEISNNRRRQEDEIIFAKIWPKPIAIFIENLYYLSSKNLMK